MIFFINFARALLLKKTYFNIMKTLIRFIIPAFIMLLCPILSHAQDITVVSETSDLIVLDVDVYNVKEKECVNNAIPAVYNATFFRGFPSSTYFRDPLVGTDESFVNQHKAYFNEMENGRFNSFITTSRLTNYDKKSKPKRGTVRFNINMRALRNDLQIQGVKRQFGL